MSQPPLPPSPTNGPSAGAASGAPADAGKRRPWIWWLVGTLATLALLCVITVAIGGYFVARGLQSQAAAVRARGGAPIYNPSANAKREIAQALATAKASNKLMLLDFGADWCPDCVVLANHMESATVKPYLDDHYVVVRVNVGQWDANLDVAQQYGNPIAKGIPAVVVVDPQHAQVVASTGGGELANARTSTKQEILDLLQQWAKRR